MGCTGPKSHAPLVAKAPETQRRRIKRVHDRLVAEAKAQLEAELKGDEWTRQTIKQKYKDYAWRKKQNYHGLDNE
jgi:hypothetical protein